MSALAAALLGRILDRIGALSGALEATGSAGSSATEELGMLADEVTRLGWALGRVGAAAEADAMGARHLPEGLAVLAGLVGGELEVVGELPRLAPVGRELRLLEALLAAGARRLAAEPRGGTWRLAWHADEAWPPGASEPAWADLGLCPLREGDAWVLDVPGHWLHDELPTQPTGDVPHGTPRHPEQPGR